jgi:hypothetical protein
VNNRVRLEGACVWPWIRHLRRPALHPLNLGSLIVLVLFLLGFWAAAIWAAVAVFAEGT